MRSFALFALLALTSSNAFAFDVRIDRDNQTVKPGMETLPVHVGGRVADHPLASPLPSGAKAYSHEWPGIYFEANFAGDELDLKFDDPANEYRAFIDNIAPLTLTQLGRVEVAITGLGPGPHAVRLEKVTESALVSASFDGFFLPNGETGAAPKPRIRQIEFIGDSDMTGYGIRSASRTCTADEVRLFSDTQIAYPALVAKRLNADYQINAISGRGLVRNFPGVIGSAMAFAYSATLPDLEPGAKQSAFESGSWAPQIFVVGLGGNDFALPLQQGEKWETNDDLIVDFLAAYVSLIAKLHERSPDAALILQTFDADSLSAADQALLNDGMSFLLAEAARKAGFKSVSTISLNEMAIEKSACAFHPSPQDHQREADWLVNFISERPEIWGPRS